MHHRIVLALAAAVAGFAAPQSESPGRLTAATPLLAARASHSATVLPDGRVLIVGGFGGSGTEGAPFRTSELYDPVTGAVTAGPELAIGRSGHTATRLASGQVLIAGGWTGPNGQSNTAELYDPAGHRFIRLANLAAPRAGSTATLLADGRVLLVGGDGEADEPLATAEIYDPATRTFHPTGSMAVPRRAHTSTLLSDGNVLVAGGSMGRYPSAVIHQEAELFDPRTGRFRPTGALAVGRHKHAAVALQDGRVLVVGGSDQRDWRGQLTSAEVYDPATARFAPVGSMNFARFKFSGAAVVLLPSHRVLIAGGANTAEVFDPDTGRFFNVAGAFDAAYYYSAAVALNDGRVFISGGYHDSRGGLPSAAATYLFRPLSRP